MYCAGKADIAAFSRHLNEHVGFPFGFMEAMGV